MNLRQRPRLELLANALVQVKIPVREQGWRADLILGDVLVSDDV